MSKRKNRDWKTWPAWFWFVLMCLFAILTGAFAALKLVPEFFKLLSAIEKSGWTCDAWVLLMLFTLFGLFSMAGYTGFEISKKALLERIWK